MLAVVLSSLLMSLLFGSLEKFSWSHLDFHWSIFLKTTDILFLLLHTHEFLKLIYFILLSVSHRFSLFLCFYFWWVTLLCFYTVSHLFFHELWYSSSSIFCSSFADVFVLPSFHFTSSFIHFRVFGALQTYF